MPHPLSLPTLTRTVATLALAIPGAIVNAFKTTTPPDSMQALKTAVTNCHASQNNILNGPAPEGVTDYANAMVGRDNMFGDTRVQHRVDNNSPNGFTALYVHSVNPPYTAEAAQEALTQALASNMLVRLNAGTQALASGKMDRTAFGSIVTRDAIDGAIKEGTVTLPQATIVPPSTYQTFTIAPRDVHRFNTLLRTQAQVASNPMGHLFAACRDSLLLPGNVINRGDVSTFKLENEMAQRMRTVLNDNHLQYSVSTQPVPPHKVAVQRDDFDRVASSNTTVQAAVARRNEQKARQAGRA